MYMTNIMLKRNDKEALYYKGNKEVLDFDFKDGKNKR